MRLFFNNIVCYDTEYYIKVFNLSLVIFPECFLFGLNEFIGHWLFKYNLGLNYIFKPINYN